MELKQTFAVDGLVSWGRLIYGWWRYHYLPTLLSVTQSKFCDELNQEKLVTSQAGITLHSVGMVTESRGLTTTVLEARLKDEMKTERVVLANILMV